MDIFQSLARLTNKKCNLPGNLNNILANHHVESRGPGEVREIILPGSREQHRRYSIWALLGLLTVFSDLCVAWAESVFKSSLLIRPPGWVLWRWWTDTKSYNKSRGNMLTSAVLRLKEPGFKLVTKIAQSNLRFVLILNELLRGPVLHITQNF